MKADVQKGLDGLSAEQKAAKEAEDALKLKQLEDRHAELLQKEVDRKMNREE